MSHSYRLAPQARMDEQVEDSLEAIAWIRANLSAIVGGDRVDADRYVICGESAGGLLASLMAHHLSPPPKAVINCYGVVDLLGSGADILAPDASVPPNLPPWTGKWTEEQLQAYLLDRDPANILTAALFWDEQEKLSDSALSARVRADFKYTERVRLQAELHMWRSTRYITKGILEGVLHAERFSSREDLREFIESLCALRLLDGSKSYPPTALVHGTIDSSVPLAQSQAFAKKLREMGVPVLESYEPGGEHVFDDKYTVSREDLMLLHGRC